MIIRTLSENTAIAPGFACEHGLSLHIESGGRKILFDTGASGKFAENADRMGVDLADVDLAVLSHDHYDHGGGLRTFLARNSRAPIYVSARAFGARYAKGPDGQMRYIGIDSELASDDRFIRVGEHFEIDTALTLFSGVLQKEYVPSGNGDLLTMRDGELQPDAFDHEQNLVICEGHKKVLVAGCAHNGIVNIIEHMINAGLGTPTHVLGGFHLYNKSRDTDEDPGRVRELGARLLTWPAAYYTCHCTGLGSYKVLKEVLGERIGYLSAGSELSI